MLDPEFLKNTVEDLYQKYLFVSAKKAKLSVVETALLRLGFSSNEISTTYDASEAFAEAVAMLPDELARKFKEVIIYETGRVPSDVAVIARTSEVKGVAIKDNWKVLGEVVIYSDEDKDVVYRKIAEESIGEHTVYIYLIAVIPRDEDP